MQFATLLGLALLGCVGFSQATPINFQEIQVKDFNKPRNLTCAAINHACDDDEQVYCCSGVCHHDVCRRQEDDCQNEGGACRIDSDCCTNDCNHGTCGTACKKIREACRIDHDCCSFECDDGFCDYDAKLKTKENCIPHNHACSEDPQCCSLECENGICRFD